MKKLSIIIVNYNVEYFLDQCLQSVFEGLEGINSEVFVVDNNSVDQSVQMVSQKYPSVQLIANTENFGFSKANNQAIDKASGEYILLLNPDTLVQKDTFCKVIDFMDAHPEAGGLGVQMIDGKGNFLPESKRGLPTPAVAFYKIFGLSRLFPRSKKFGKYHLSYLDKSQTHEIDVLSGAFMMLRKSVLDLTGTLDEQFFMYGEDIDLSYRITKAGFKNYYFADTKIIHYKGESTKKGSLNYVVTFYNAMRIFAEKHYSDNKLKAFTFFIKMAIFFRATIAIVHRFFKRLLLPIVDFALLSAGFYTISHYWQQYIIFPDGGSYPEMLLWIALPSYVLIWMFSSYLSGGYDKPVRIDHLLRGMIAGTVLILLIYSILDDSMRFSRALIFLGALWAFVSMLITRFLLHRLDLGHQHPEKKKFLIVGDHDEPERVKQIILQSSQKPPIMMGFISTSSEMNHSANFLGNLSQIEDIIRIYGIHEVVFCARNLSAADIIDKMSALQHTGVDMKIAPADSIFIIGSNSINASGDIYIIHVNNIDKPENRRNKRTLDVAIALLFIAFLPLGIWFVRKPFNWLKNILLVILGFKSWVGYTAVKSQQKLPHIKKGILSPSDQIVGKKELDEQTKVNLNIIYARDYRVGTDLNIIRKGFAMLGN